MHTKAKFLSVLSQILGSPQDLSDLRARFDDPGFSWTAFIEFSNAQFLTAALWPRLEHHGLCACLPDDAKVFLQTAFELNGERNQTIREQALELVGWLNADGIVPLILKGGTHLFELDRTAFGCRMMLDLDLMIDQRKFTKAIKIIKSSGYEIITPWPNWTYHYPALGRPGDQASLEVHCDAGEQRTLLSNETAFDQAVSLEAEGLRVLALSPTHRVVHNIFNAQIQDRNHEMGRIALKQLFDLALIVERHGDQIDWPRVRATFAAKGYSRACEAYLYQAQSLLHLPLDGPIASVPAERHLARCQRQLGRPWSAKAWLYWAAVSHPFRRCRIEYIYGDKETGGGLLKNRLRRAGTLAWRHRFDFGGKLRSIYRDLYSGGTRADS